MSVAEQALLTERAANARTTLHRSAMVMGIGGTIIFMWLLFVGGYAGLTSNRLKQIAVDRKKADEHFRALLETAPDAMVLVGQDGRMVLVNAQTEKLFGYARAELLGNTVDMLVPAALSRSGIRKSAASTSPTIPKSRRWAPVRSSMACARIAREFPIEISLSRIETEDGLLICQRHPRRHRSQAGRGKSRASSMTASARCWKPRPTRWSW